MSVVSDSRQQASQTQNVNDQQAIQLKILKQANSKQQQLIVQLRKQIEVLQNEGLEIQKKRSQLQKLHNEALQMIQTQRQKIETLRENNQSIIHTLQAFQREFVKRDYKTGINFHIQKQKVSASSDGPLFLELLRNMKSKFSQANETALEEKSHLNEYYGYFLNEEVQQRQTELFNQIKQKKLTMSSVNIKNKIRGFGKKHYFNQKYRHYFWYHIMDKPLRITKLLYDDLNQKCKIARQTQQEGKVSLIDRDLNRMDFKLEEEKSKDMKLVVRDCLELFEIFRPDLGYVQGMSYLAWMLLIRLDQYEAFSCFSNLILCDPFISSLYFFKQDKIKKIKQFYEKCMEEKRSKVHKHMKNLEVECELFIIEWAYTMFTRAFNLRICSKIWDLWLSEGFNVFFKVVLVVIDMLETQILQINQNDKVIELIRTQTHKLNEVQFLKNLKKQKLPQELQF